MGTPDANGWIKGLDDAPKDEIILVCFPTADNEVEFDFAAWDEGDQVWAYDSYHADGDKPTHWIALTVPIDLETAEAAA